ncbi:11330_t:CDS:2, partial [Gigaspora margarita]
LPITEKHLNTQGGLKFWDKKSAKFKYITKKSKEDEEDEWDSDIYNNMDNDDLLQVDEMDELEEMNDNTLALIVPTNNETSSNKSMSKKWSLCQGLQSEQIFNYIKCSLAQFSGLCRVEVVARELFPKLFHQKFNRKKLAYNQKQMLNHALYAESTWQIDQNGNAMHTKTCSGVAEKGNICNEYHYIWFDKNLCNRLSQKMPSSENIKFMPKFYWENSPLKNHFQNRDLHDVWNLLNNDNENQSNPWIILADKAINGAFKDSLVFSGLCQVMSDATEQKAKKKGNQNMKYSDEFTNFLIILESIVQEPSIYFVKFWKEEESNHSGIIYNNTTCSSKD